MRGADRRIPHDYTLSAARAFQQLGTPEKPFSFIYISGEGADQAEKSWTLFGKIKGRTEKALAEMSSESFKTVSLRPGAILMTKEVRTWKMTWTLMDAACQPNGYIIATWIDRLSSSIQDGHAEYDDQLLGLGFHCFRAGDKLAGLG